MRLVSAPHLMTLMTLTPASATLLPLRLQATAATAAAMSLNRTKVERTAPLAQTAINQCLR